MPAWTPELLDRMRHQGDALADEAFARAASLHGEVSRISKVFRSFAADDAQIPADAPPVLLEFVAATAALPAGLDPARVQRGAQVMLDHAVLCALALLLKSLPSGYAAPRLSSILELTQNLEKRPYRRALGVLQMLVNIATPAAFEPAGRAVVTGQKLRLLHAGIRHVVQHRLPDFAARHGTPVSQLDMVFTIMTFSLHVIDGLAELGVALPPAQADDYFHLWRMYGLLQGVQPEWMPADMAEGRAFVQAYRRELSSAEHNGAGVRLTAADLAMMKGLLPAPLRWLGFGVAPRLYLLRMLGVDDAARLGVTPPPAHALLDALLLKLPVLWARLTQAVLPDARAHAWLSRLFFQQLIDDAWQGHVTFSVPEHLRDLRRLG